MNTKDDEIPALRSICGDLTTNPTPAGEEAQNNDTTPHPPPTTNDLVLLLKSLSNQ